MAKRLFIRETNGIPLQQINESVGKSKDGKIYLQGVFATLEKMNRNYRIYTEDEYLKHLDYLQKDLKNGVAILGELDHPDDRFEVKLKEASHRVVDLWYDKAKKQVMGKIELLDTPNGNIAKHILESGVPLNISARASGEVDTNNHAKIQRIYTFDLVAKPGFEEAVLHQVSESEKYGKFLHSLNESITESNKKNVAKKYGILNESITIFEMEDFKEKTEEEEDIYTNQTNQTMEGSSKEQKDKLILGASLIQSIDKDEKDDTKDDKFIISAKYCYNECPSDKDDIIDEGSIVFDRVSEIKDHEIELINNIDLMIDRIKKEKAVNETIKEEYPISALLTESNFKLFAELDTDQKENVSKYLANNVSGPDQINESYTEYMKSKNAVPLWLEKAPVSYKKMYESADQSVKNSINFSADYFDLSSPEKINNFWENVSGLKNSLLNESEQENIPLINKDEEFDEGALYDDSYIDQICKYMSERFS